MTINDPSGRRWMRACFLAAFFISPGVIASVEGNEIDTLRYGAYLDLSWAKDLEGGGHVGWRSKASTQRLNRFNPNLSAVYVRMEESVDSPFGFELGGQGGTDTAGQVPVTDRITGYDVLPNVSAANVPYRTPIGSGLTLIGGLRKGP